MALLLADANPVTMNLPSLWRAIAVACPFWLWDGPNRVKTVPGGPKFSGWPEFPKVVSSEPFSFRRTEQNGNCPRSFVQPETMMILLSG
jgi:hypothetical protein